jgi:putative ATP-binding cassette transporter
MVLPQRPYLPIGTLRAALCYPRPATAHDDAALRGALERVELAALGARLDEEAHWAQSLSGGEQQRVALARVFLERPAWLFLDEATAAIDEDAELVFYHRLRSALPALTYVTIAHRGSLREVHARRFRVMHASDGTLELREDKSAPIP